MSEENLPELYITLSGEGSADFEVKRSVFIGHAKHVISEEQEREFIKVKKKEYADATHNCWGYVLRGGIVARYSDDGEPQGTAGVPILETIRKSGVNDAVVVVTRYFGGTLLGAGGLVRAYSQGAKIALEAAGIVTYEKYSEFLLECSYSDYQKYIALLPKYGAVIDNADFADRVTLRFAVKKSGSLPLIEKIAEMSGGKDSLRDIGERYDYR